MFDWDEGVGLAMGMVRGKVYLSRGLIEIVDEGEMDGVVYEELDQK